MPRHATHKLVCQRWNDFELAHVFVMFIICEQSQNISRRDEWWAAQGNPDIDCIDGDTGILKLFVIRVPRIIVHWCRRMIRVLRAICGTRASSTPFER
jgi:hypothetical protein